MMSDELKKVLPLSSPSDFFLQSSALLCILDVEGTIIQVNPAWETKWGIAHTQLLQSHFLSWVHPEDKVSTHTHLSQLASGVSNVTFVNRWRDGMKNYRWLQWEMNTKLLAGNTLQFYAVAIDITSQKIGEKALAHTKERYELAVKGSNYGLWDWNLATNEIYLSPKWKNMLGYQDPEIANHLDEWCRFIHPEDFPIMWAGIEAYLDKHAPFYESTYRMRHKNGSYSYVLARAAALWDAENRPYRMVGTYVDITHQIQVEQALRQSEERLQLITSNAPIILFAVDMQGKFTFSRGKALKTLDSSDDELIGHSIFDICAPYPQEIQYIQRALVGQSTTSVRVLPHSVLETKYAPLLDAHYHIIGVIGVSVDITTRYVLERKLKETIRELETILDSSIIGIAYVKDGQILRANHKLEILLGFLPDELCGHPFIAFYPSKEDYQQIEKQAAVLLSQGKTFETGQLIATKTHKMLWCRLGAKAIDSNDLSKGIIWMIEDITLQKQAEQNLQLTAAVFETTIDGIVITDLQTRIQRVNPAFTKITGYSAEEVYGEKISILASGRHDKSFYKKMWEIITATNHWQGEVWNRRKTGELYVAWLSISAITNEQGEPMQYMAITTDISRLQEDIENARYLASYDSLTRLPNRLLFHDNLLQAQAWARRHQSLFALLFIDLDGFKPVNDQWGHAIGDQLLQSVAARLLKCVRESDTVARLGGDEFTIILNNIKKPEDAAKVATKIIRIIQQPFPSGEQEIKISTSIGITLYPGDGHDIDVLLKQADTAMYAAKRLGKGCFCFYEDIIGK